MVSPADSALVIGVASSALFDLGESNRVFEEQGEAAYRDYQQEHYDDRLAPGVAFSFIRRLLALNDLSDSSGAPLVEVVVLSRNDPETGARVMRSIATHDLPITRAVFMQGRAPYAFMPAFDMTLFLSANRDDVRRAMKQGYAAGQVLGTAEAYDDDPDGPQLRIAFDFDAVLADDSAERRFRKQGLDKFKAYEEANAAIPLDPGPMKNLLAGINRIQDLENARAAEDENYRRRVFVSIVTARNAPAYARAIFTLKSWGLRVNDAFFLGGWDKSLVLDILRPHIFFDDQMRHLERASAVVPSVHVPFGLGDLGDEGS